MLILLKSENQISQNRFEEWNEFVACVLLKSGKSTAASLLHAFVVVEDHPKQLRIPNSARDKGEEKGYLPPPGSAQKTAVCVLLKWAEYTNQHNGRESNRRSIGRGAGGCAIKPGRSAVQLNG